MTFNEVLNSIAHNRYTYSFVMLYKFPSKIFGLEFKVVFFIVLANIEVDIIFYYMCLCCSASW